MSLLYLFHRLIIKHNTDSARSAVGLQEISHVSFSHFKVLSKPSPILKSSSIMKSLYSCKIAICGRNLSLAKICSPAPARSRNMTEISCVQKKWDPFKLRRRVSLPQTFVETWLICIKEILVHWSKICQYRKNYFEHNFFTSFLSLSTTFIKTGNLQVLSSVPILSIHFPGLPPMYKIFKVQLFGDREKTKQNFVCS